MGLDAVDSLPSGFAGLFFRLPLNRGGCYVKTHRVCSQAQHAAYSLLVSKPAYLSGCTPSSPTALQIMNLLVLANK